jgi:hypothetical protein
MIKGPGHSFDEANELVKQWTNGKQYLEMQGADVALCTVNDELSEILAPQLDYFRDGENLVFDPARLRDLVTTGSVITKFLGKFVVGQKTIADVDAEVEEINGGWRGSFKLLRGELPEAGKKYELKRDDGVACLVEIKGLTTDGPGEYGGTFASKTADGVPSNN